MIAGIGVDITKVSRFEEWAKKPRRQLERILTPQEIDYCLESPALAAQRFAARWAAKEAYFKALPVKGAFLKVARGIEVRGPLMVRTFDVSTASETRTPRDAGTEWFQNHMSAPQGMVSLSHEKEYAIAFVLLYNPPISPIL